jgi:hypothetical protein
LIRRRADLCLAVFPTNIPQHLGPVRVEPDGRIVEVLDKPSDTALSNTWGAAVWSPRLSRLLHRRVMAHVAPGDLVLADVFNQAIRDGMPAYALQFSEGTFTDVGLADGLQSLLLRNDPARA